MATNTYDAIVVGSGISGGWAAKELTEKGLKTLLLERGRNIEHIKDYVNANKAPWEFPHRGNPTQQMKNDYPVAKREYVLNETNLDYWVDERESPYIEKQRFDWYRGYHVGGRSLMWGRQSYRWHNMDFEANAKDGIAVDWPIRYADLAPWYSYVERFAGISGNKDGIAILPDGEYMPPMELNIVEKDVAARLKGIYKGSRHMIIGRTANITQPHDNRTNCQYRNKCWLGCPFGAYFSTQSSTLPAAMRTGNLTLRPWSIVTKVIYDKDTKLAKGVEVLDAETNQTYEYYAKVIFLNASTINTAAILMRSATDIWPGGLGSSSDQLGHNIMDHHLNVGASGMVDGYEDKYTYGRRANGIYIPRYRNLNGEKRDYIRGFGYQGSASRERWSRNIPEMALGAKFKDELSEPGSWKMGIGGFGEVLPYHENRMWLDDTKKDKWGLSVPAIDAVVRDNENKMRIDMMNDAAEMLEATGLKNVNPYNDQAVLGRGIHEMGTARMGRDPKSSVLNEWNQVWDAKNVYVTDGAAMTSAACQNPSLTYMALTARAADHAVSELKKMNI
ncbi:GMC family oxidoreductase [Mucilaginibacter terrae]|uniref:Choline dehydrogenase-like flavoprotein n=1 Tax=Mucilaginibacter terrae TaxID=1955052 RepID=A0ABU3GQB1_9SPHI|nr:GMC family oxidoreductase [Mucilaginibacter terrae]MDT3401974.1 choline dehydrogenase-like flavoprotein [Mucilaginibacter terrae]